MKTRIDISVANLGELATVAVTPLVQGANAWVDDQQDYWTLEKNSGVAVGPDAIAPLSGAPSGGAANARWIRNTGGSSLGGALAFTIYREGAINPEAPVYGTMIAALTAAIAGGAPTLYVDSSLGQPNIPAGNYPFEGIRLEAWGPANFEEGVYITLQDGAIFTGNGMPVMGQGLTIDSFASHPVCTINKPGSGQYLWMNNSSGLFCDGPAPFIDVVAGTLIANMTQDSFFSGTTAGGSIIRVAAGAVCNAYCGPQAQIAGAHVFAGAGNIVVERLSPSAIIAAVQADVTGSYSVQEFALASAVGYTAAVPGNYLTPPTQAKQALDELAAAGKTFSLDVTLVGGTKAQASGKDLTNATLVGIKLKTPITAVGQPQATFVAGPNGIVTVTSFGPTAAQLVTDVSVYTCVFLGAA